MLRKSVLTLALAVAGLSLGSLGAGCGPGEENGGEGGGTDAGRSELACGEGHAEVTAEQVYTDVFRDNCASCHTVSTVHRKSGCATARARTRSSVCACFSCTTGCGSV